MREGSMDSIDVIAEMIADAQKIVVFTGAGFSTESEVPDFRGPLPRVRPPCQMLAPR